MTSPNQKLAIVACLLAFYSVGFSQGDLDVAVQSTEKPQNVDNVIQRLKSEPPNENHATVMNGHALVGVDVLGRIAIAFDARTDSRQPDGIVDYFILFTAPERLGGSWGKTLDKAMLVDSGGNVVLRSMLGELGMSLTVEGWRHRQLPPDVGETIEVDNGFGIRRVAGDDSLKLAISDISFDDIESWPTTFWYDALSPQRIGECTPSLFVGCSSGGQFAKICMIGGCQGLPASCNVTCNGVTGHACCACDAAYGDPPPASCRCIVCKGGSPP